MKAFIILFLGAIFTAMMITKPEDKKEPYHKDLDYEFKYSEEQFKAIEDSVKKENLIRD